MRQWWKRMRLRTQMRRLAIQVLDEEYAQDILNVHRWLALEEQDAKAFDDYNARIVHSQTVKRDLLLQRKELALQLERL
jgi:hypothetical protein